MKLVKFAVVLTAVTVFGVTSSMANAYVTHAHSYATFSGGDKGDKGHEPHEPKPHESPGPKGGR